jgi:hypothetical protein
MFVKTMVSVALIVLFAGCASYGSGYRDGAYYRPSRGDEGDYYYGRPPVNRGYYRPYYGPYGTPFYYSPYPYYQPYRYRPYYGPYRSSYYGSGFGASYAYGGFAGYRDYGYSGFGLGFVYSDRDRSHGRGRHDRRGRNDRDAHNRSDHDERRDGQMGRFGAAPISDGRHRRDAQPGRPGYGHDPRVFERRLTQPTPGLRVAPEQPATVRFRPDGGRIVQMRRVDVEQGKNKQRLTPQPTPRPTRVAPVSSPETLRAGPAPVYRGTRENRPLSAREATAPNQPPSRSSPQARSSQRGLNEEARDAGKKTRNSSQLKKVVDTVDE